MKLNTQTREFLPAHRYTTCSPIEFATDLLVFTAVKRDLTSPSIFGHSMLKNFDRLMFSGNFPRRFIDVGPRPRDIGYTIFLHKLGSDLSTSRNSVTAFSLSIQEGRLTD